MAWIGRLRGASAAARSATSSPHSALGRTTPSMSRSSSSRGPRRCSSVPIGLILTQRCGSPSRRSGSRPSSSRAIGLLCGNDAVLQVEDDRVGAALQRLHHLLVAVRRDEQPAARRGAQKAHAGFFRSSAERVHLHTSSPRWLKLRCSQVTIPAFGRDLLSRTSRHSLSLRSVSPTKTGEGKISLS